MASTTNQASTELLKRAYSAFNARDLDGALATMRTDVVWPNGMEGGVVHGHEGVRAYWTRQWGMINPHVDPEGFSQDEAGRVIVSVHQVVRDNRQRASRSHGRARLHIERRSHSEHGDPRVAQCDRPRLVRLTGGPSGFTLALYPLQSVDGRHSRGCRLAFF
jgi:ketosteroid isomerase-like protein